MIPLIKVSSPTSPSNNSQPNQYMSGYLFKRSHNNTFKKWNRRWFTLISSKLYYQKRNDFGTLNQMEYDLRVCKVREVNDNERRFTFEIVSPKCRHLLQADSQRDCNMWIQSINKAIDDALNTTTNSSLNNISNSSFNSSSTNDNNLDDCDSNEIVINNGEFLDSNDVYNQIYNNLNKSNSFNNESSLNGTNGSHQLTSNSSFKSLKDLDINNSNNSSQLNSIYNDHKKNFILTQIKGNQSCCDCGAPNPTWVK